ncbi:MULTISPECIES: hypothetical protein [unclassified Wolbachia]|uniref:hypothetical protein n=1 Tax=unclassified Wolbachia TaxID=2640676 RepID=UPI0021F8E933|nr:hypothetical protein [Wolbachia endosymbiont (group A) of Cheilosia soror]
MADPKVSITFNNEISECLIGLAEVRNKSVKELTEKLMRQAIELEEDMILIERAAELDVPGAKKIRSEDINWDTVLAKRIEGTN